MKPDYEYESREQWEEDLQKDRIPSNVEYIQDNRECTNGHRYAHYECVDCGKKLKKEVIKKNNKVKDYCECPQEELNYLNIEITKYFHECPICHKQDYGTWWADEMNKKK